jgi:hypothetical protein
MINANGTGWDFICSSLRLVFFKGVTVWGKAAVIPLFDTTEARGALLSRRIGSARRQWWLTHLVARA